MSQTYSVMVRLRGKWTPTDTRGAHEAIAQYEAARWRALGFETRIEKD